MCFNQCNNFKFSPLEGEGSCSLPSDKTCPTDEDETTEDEANKIILENLALRETISIIEMVDRQEELIEKFIKLGYTREEFYLYSRLATEGEPCGK